MNAAKQRELSTFEARLKGLLRGAGVQVVGLAALRVEPGWSESWAGSRAPGLWRVYWNRGPMRLKHDGGTHDLPSKTLGLIPPLGGFKPEVDAHTEHGYLHFQLPGLPAGLLGEILTTPLVFPAERATAGLMADLFREAATRRQPGPDVPFRAQAVASLAFAAAIRQLPDDASSRLFQALRGENPISPALARIQGQTGDPAGLDELARLCGMSRRAFSDSFKLWTGLPPWQYQLRERLSRAAELLMHTDDSIERVAARTGFSDRFHLSKAFRRAHGQSPAAFRKRLQARRREDGAKADTCGHRH